MNRYIIKEADIRKIDQSTIIDRCSCGHAKTKFPFTPLVESETQFKNRIELSGM